MQKNVSLCLTALAAMATLASCRPGYDTAEATDFNALLSESGVQLVDVRTKTEFDSLHIPEAINIDVRAEGFEAAADSLLQQGQPVAVYCRSGVRGKEASKLLAAKGFTVTNLDGGFLAWRQAGFPEADGREYLVRVGQEAPDFTVEIYDPNAEYPEGYKGSADSEKASYTTLSELRGKVVLLQFTASWCGVCRREMPHLESDVWQPYKDNPDFAFIGIDRDETAQEIAGFIKTTGVSYPFGFDPDADIFALYAARTSGITRNVLIDKDGKIAFLTRLYNDEEFAALKAKLAELLQRP